MKNIGKNIHAKPSFDPEGYQRDMDSLNGEALPGLGQVKAKPLGHGGARPGAGRKRSNRMPISFRLTPATIRKIRLAAKRKGVNPSEAAEAYLSRIPIKA